MGAPQYEIKPDFTIDEADSDACRARFLAEHRDDAAAIREKEDVRRERAEEKKSQPDQDDANDADDGNEDEPDE